MTVTIYGRPNSGSLAVEILLEELGRSYDRVLVTGYRENIQPPSFAEINPLRAVPALTLDDGTLLTESGAMMIYLADAHPGAGLAPAIGDATRGPYLRWITYLAASFYPTAMCLFHPENYVDDATLFDAVKARATTVIHQQWQVIDSVLGAGRGHLVGGRLSAADLYAFMFAYWFADDPEIGGSGATARFLEAMNGRPSVKRILARHVSREA